MAGITTDDNQHVTLATSTKVEAVQSPFPDSNHNLDHEHKNNSDPNSDNSSCNTNNFCNRLGPIPSFSSAQARRLVLGYIVGSIFFARHSRLSAKADGKLVKIIVLGCSNAGKTSTIISIFTALLGENVIQWGARGWKVSASRSASVVQATTGKPTTYRFETGMKDGERCAVEITDSRGCTEKAHYSEGLKMLTGELPTTATISRTEEERRVIHRLWLDHNNFVQREFDAAILILPSDTLRDKDVMNDYQIYKQIPEGFPVVNVITGIDIEPDISHVLTGMNLNESQVLQFTPYHSKDPNNPTIPPNDQVNERTDAQSLNILMWAITSADGEGLGACARSRLALAPELAAQKIGEALRGTQHTQVVLAGLVGMLFTLVVSMLLGIMPHFFKK